jgi:hypothetical protein
LNSAYIRTALIRAFASVGRDRPNVPQTIVYAHPSIEALSTWLWQELTGKGTGMETDVGASVEAMKSMISGQLEILADSVRAGHRTNGTNGVLGAVPTQGAKRAVLVTGTTGALGAHLLETLLSASSVDEVFALNRRSRSSAQVESRQKAAFGKRGIAQGLLESPKLVFVDADRVEDITPEVISRVRGGFRFLRRSAT